MTARFSASAPARSPRPTYEVPQFYVFYDEKMQKLRITRPDDWHLHLRDSAALKAVLPQTVRQFARAIIMPNLKPPVRSVADARDYRDRILAAIPAGKQFEPLMTLYLTDNTSPEEIIAAKASQFVKALKYYSPTKLG